MSRIPDVRRGALLVVAALALVVAGAWPESQRVSADQPEPILALTFQTTAAAGEAITVSAYLVDPAGNPIAGQPITLTMKVIFQNVLGTVELDRVTTDEYGLALFLLEPRSEGDLELSAHFAGNDIFGPAVATGPLTVETGPDQYLEARPFRVPGASVWMVVGIVVVVWMSYVVALLFGWRAARASRIPGPEIDRLPLQRETFMELGTGVADLATGYQAEGLLDEPQPPPPRLPAWLPPTRVPLLAAGGVFAGLLVIVVQGTLRPWADSTYAYETHFNFAGVTPEYGRTNTSMVGATPAPLEGWVPAAGVEADAEDIGRVNYVAFGCASCHGMRGEGLPAGPPIAGDDARRTATLTRKGPGNMPYYDEVHLVAARMDAIGAYLQALPAAPEVTPLAIPAPTPYPTATPTPTPTPTPAPTPTPTPTPLPPGAPTPTPSPTPSPTPTPTPTPTPDPARLKEAQELYVIVGCDLCHGADGLGAEDGPGLGGLSADRHREYTRNPTEPDDRWKPMDPYPPADLSDEELEIITYFLVNLPG